MTDLFETAGEAPTKTNGLRPLADRLRPQVLAEVIGQKQILGPEGPLSVMLAAKALGSIIFWGPSKCYEFIFYFLSWSIWILLFNLFVCIFFVRVK